MLYTKIIAVYYENCKKNKMKCFRTTYQLEAIVSYKMNFKQLLGTAMKLMTVIYKTIISRRAKVRSHRKSLDLK